jgi:hypothetical protein
MISSVNLWLLFAGTVLLAFLSHEAGFRLGRFRSRRADKVKDVPSGWIMNATIGLFAFMLAFTYGLAAADFGLRERAVVKDADAIRAAYSMAGFLPESRQPRVKQLLREYVDGRLQAVQQLHELRELLLRSEEIHDLLWAESSASGLFAQSLREMVTAHFDRLAILRKQIHPSIWIVLYLLLILSMSSAGYLGGLVNSRGRFVLLNLAVGSTLVLILIADLDRPQQGVFKVSQQAMADLHGKMSKDYQDAVAN